jgi:hypothetical protein
MDEDPIGNAMRRTRRQVLLGPDAYCLMCGEKNPDVLRLVKRTLLDEHHVAGRDNIPDLTVPVCANCHRKLTAALHNEGLDFKTPCKHVVLEVLYCLIIGMGVLFEESAKAFKLLGKALRALIESLDTHFGGWRDLPEAQF